MSKQKLIFHHQSNKYISKMVKSWVAVWLFTSDEIKKQPPGRVPGKRCSKNLLHIFRTNVLRTPLGGCFWRLKIHDSHLKCQVANNCLMFASGWKWYRGIITAPWIISVCDIKPREKEKGFFSFVLKSFIMFVQSSFKFLGILQMFPPLSNGNHF